MSVESDEPVVVRELGARSFMDGPEHCREYFRTPLLWFGTSTLQSAQTGALDNGHPDAQEVFFCARGRAVVDLGSQSFELREGDAVLIPKGVPHTISNVGSDELVIVWAGAPNE
jgi:uncharacterized protein YjlB